MALDAPGGPTTAFRHIATSSRCPSVSHVRSPRGSSLSLARHSAQWRVGVCLQARYQDPRPILYRHLEQQVIPAKAALHYVIRELGRDLDAELAMTQSLTTTVVSYLRWILDRAAMMFQIPAEPSAAGRWTGK